MNDQRITTSDDERNCAHCNDPDSSTLTESAHELLHRLVAQPVSGQAKPEQSSPAAPDRANVGTRFTAQVARALTPPDVKPIIDPFGKPATWSDGMLRWQLVIPVLTAGRDQAEYGIEPAPMQLAVSGPILDELSKAMLRAGVQPDADGSLLPEAGAVLTIALTIEYARPAAQPQFDSPIERLFWEAHLATQRQALNGLVAQYPVLGGRYRLDFALPDSRIGIELDGFATHSSTAAIAKDRKRQRDLEAAGWRVIRFGGAEIHADAAGCVEQTARLIRQIRAERRSS